MNIDPEKRYIMPLSMGPADRWYSRGSAYRERQILSLQYQTEPEAISALLPGCYRPTDEATVTVAFIYCDGVSFMAGGGYRIATVMVAVRFDGEEDHIVGNYPLVMFEDDTLPILLGRERLGIHKIYGDVSPVRTLPNGHLRCEASLWGHLLFGIELEPPVRQDESVCAAASARANGVPLLGYKYIPSLEGPPDAAYPISTPGEVTIEQLWLGQTGGLSYGDPEAAGAPFIEAAVDMLKTLPVRQVTGVSRSRDSFILRSDISRRLR